MLNDSEDFTEPAAKKRAQPSGGLSKRAKREVSNAVDPNSNILVHPKWENAPFVTKLKGLLKEAPSSTDQSYKVDFKPESASPLRASGHKTNQSLNSSIGGDNQLDLESGEDLSVLILTEPEYVGAGNTLFKRRLAKLVTSKASSAAHAVVIVVRSARTPPQDFLNLQLFCTVELGLALIPISDNLDKHLPQLLVQLITSRKKKKNPFKLGAPKSNCAKKGALGPILTTLSTVPGLSDKKAKDLVERFGSLKAIATAEVADLAPVVGKATANSVHLFFHQSKPQL